MEWSHPLYLTLRSVAEDMKHYFIRLESLQLDGEDVSHMPLFAASSRTGRRLCEVSAELCASFCDFFELVPSPSVHFRGSSCWKSFCWSGYDT